MCVYTFPTGVFSRSSNISCISIQRPIGCFSMNIFCARCRGSVDVIDECTLDHASYANMQCSNLSPIQTYCTCAYPLQISGARLYGKPEASYEAPSKSDIKSHAKPTTSKPITIKPQKRLSTRLLPHPLGMDIPVRKAGNLHDV